MTALKVTRNFIRILSICLLLTALVLVVLPGFSTVTIRWSFAPSKIVDGMSEEELFATVGRPDHSYLDQDEVTHIYYSDVLALHYIGVRMRNGKVTHWWSD